MDFEDHQSPNQSLERTPAFVASWGVLPGWQLI